MLLTLLALGACGSDRVAGSADTASADPPAEEAALDLDTTGAAATAGNDLNSTRAVILTAHLELAADDVDVAASGAIDVIERLDGHVAAEDTRLRSSAHSLLTFEVPPARFRTALVQLGELGTVESQSVGSEDVTDLVVDIESRIATADASVERLRALLHESGSISDIATVEAQLLQRETTLEQLRGQLRTVTDQVAMSTISLSIQETATDADDPLPGVLDALAGGFGALTGAAYLGVLAIAALAPWVPVVVAAALSVRWVRGRRPHRQIANPGPQAAK